MRWHLRRKWLSQLAPPAQGDRVTSGNLLTVYLHRWDKGPSGVRLIPRDTGGRERLVAVGAVEAAVNVAGADASGISALLGGGQGRCAGVVHAREKSDLVRCSRGVGKGAQRRLLVVTSVLLWSV